MIRKGNSMQSTCMF